MSLAGSTLRISLPLAAAAALAIGTLGPGCLELVVPVDDQGSGGYGGASGGGGGAGASSGAGGSGGAGGEICMLPAYGDCDGPEDCHCVLCSTTAVCTEGGIGCWSDFECNELDSCPCAECDWDGACFGCVDDGECSPQFEGCGCSDCWQEPTCLDNAAFCHTGEPDGICDQGEPCRCNDCLLHFDCLCYTNGSCEEENGLLDIGEPCVCPDCWTAPWCGSCDDDGICRPMSPHFEDCACADCASDESCAGY